MSNHDDSLIVTSEAEPSLHRVRVQAELVKMLYRQTRTILLGLIATASIVAIIFFNNVPNEHVLIWIVLVYFLTFIRYLFFRQFKSKERDSDDIIKWGWQFAFFAFLSGCTWGAASLVFFTPENMQLFMILTLIILGMTVASMAAVSAFLWAYYAYAIPSMLPLVWQYMNMDDQAYYFFGISILLFIVIVFTFARVIHRTLRQSIMLRFENIELVHQLTEQKEKAESANFAKTQFLAAASHDLRQPIHAMSLFLDILEERSSDAEQMMIIDKIKKSSMALENLLVSLLDISKLDAGVITVKETSFDIQHLFDILENEFKHVALEKNLKIRFIHTSLWVNTDKQLLERILRNLISNAISYTEKGRILIGCRRTTDSVVISVCDTGIGIEADKTNIIFEEFQQIDNPGRDRSKGLGLGLSIVARLVDLLNAQLFFHSKPGQGSIFSVKLARSPANEIIPTENSSFLIGNELAGKMIVIVEDEEEIRLALNLLLSGWGCKVLELSCLKEVNQHQLTSNKPDMILADYRLQNLETGVEVIHAIHAFYQDKTIPAAIITGDTAPDRIKEAQKSGFPILYKPVSGGKLRILLNSLS